MDAWSLMRGDAFIHFVCGSRRVNIRLGVLLLIPKSPQIPNGKKRNDACVKKKGNLLTKRNRLSFSFRQWPAIWQHHFAVWCLGTTHTSLDVALVSPFHPVAVLSMVRIILKYKRPTNELQTNPYETLTKFQKKTNPYASPKYKMRANTCMNVFWHFNWEIQPFQCIQEKLPHPWNGCWTQ